MHRIAAVALFPSTTRAHDELSVLEDPSFKAGIADRPAPVARLVDGRMPVIAVDTPSDRRGHGADSLRTCARSTSGEFSALGAAAHSSPAVRPLVAKRRPRCVIAFETGVPAAWYPPATRAIDERLVAQAPGGCNISAFRQP